MQKIPLAALTLWLTIQVTVAAQVLFSDFESGALETWNVAGDQVHVVGPNTWSSAPGSYRWLYFGARDVAGLQPEFHVPANEFLGNLAGHRFVWSYDQENWSFFDDNDLLGFDYRFQNEEPFSQDQVFIAYSTPYTVSRVSQFVEDLAREWFVFPTASGSRDLTVGHSQDLPLFGFRITNPLSDSAKTKILLVSGNHSGEMGGNYALEGLLDFLSSDDERAKQLRNVADFYVYPLVDPLGRSEGYYRGNSQNPWNDHNRFWNSATTGDNGGFEELDVLTTAMRSDTGADVDFTFDFHGFFSTADNFIYADTPGTETDFLEELLRLEPNLELTIDDSSEPAGILEFWAKTPSGLDSEFAFTPEFSPNRSITEWKESGKNYGLALYAELGRSDFSQSSREIDVLTKAILSGENNMAFDLNRDGQTDRIDRIFLLTAVLDVVAGDTDLSGTVDFADFLLLSASFGTPAGWQGGDFDGDGLVNFADFFQLSGNFGRPHTMPVTEPKLMSFWPLVLLLMRGRGGRASKRTDAKGR